MIRIIGLNQLHREDDQTYGVIQIPLSPQKAAPSRGAVFSL